jgi:hypothetical protein
MTTHHLPAPETEVPAGETPAATCPHCERPFHSERARDLHVGEHHDEDASDAERTAYDAAREDERDDLWVFHAKVVVSLGVIYSSTVLIYMVVLGGVL